MSLHNDRKLIKALRGAADSLEDASSDLIEIGAEIKKASPSAYIPDDPGGHKKKVAAIRELIKEYETDETVFTPL